MDDTSNVERPLGSGYLLDSVLGSGAMGQVWRAHSRQGAPVAIKILRTEFTSDSAFVARFLQEAQILKGVSSPNLVAVRDLVAEGTTLGVVMDLVDGPDLRRELAAQGTFTPAAACFITDQVLAGLSAVHAASIIHRDVKPENVLVDRDEQGMARLRITDFGVARIVEQGPAARTTAVIGTPEYMAPELAEGELPTPQSDLYAVGIMLYELLTGVTPFVGGSPMAVMRRHVGQQAGRPEEMPEPLWGLINSFIAKSPAARPASADAARAQLAAVAPALAQLDKLARLETPPVPFKSSSAATVLASSPGTMVPDPAPQQEPQKRKQRWLVPVALVVVLALALGGGFIVWRLVAPGAPVAAATGESTPTASASDSDAAPSASTTPTPSVSPSPTPSAAEATAPDVVGQQLSQATLAIHREGFEVVVEEELNEQQAENTVLSQSPLPGEPVPDGIVTLTVSRQLVASFLDEWSIVEAGGRELGSDTVTINGTTYAHGLYSDLDGWDGSGDTQYDLGRHYRTLTTTLGLTDSSNSGCSVRFEILLDGRVAETHDLGLGEEQPVEVDLTGVLRLRFALTRLNDSYPCYAALGDAQILGLPSEIPTPAPSETP